MSYIDDVVTRLREHEAEDLQKARDTSEILATVTERAERGEAEAQRIKAEFDAHMKLPHGTTPPTQARTFFGGCPASGGTSLAAQRSVFLKYGGDTPVTVRQFFATGRAPRAPKTEVLRLHASWNLSGMKVADITPAWVESATFNMLEDDEGEVIHEADKKVTDGKRTYEECLEYKNRFYDIMRQVRPDLKVVNTLTGGSLSSYGGDKEERWGKVRAHLVGCDMDGVHDKTGPTIDTEYDDEVANTVKFVEKYQYEGAVVPEFGTSRPSYDPDGKLRALWITKNVGFILIASIFQEVNAYEYNSTPGNEFAKGSPEFAAFDKFVNLNGKLAA